MSKEKLQAVKGMNDVLPSEMAKWHFVERRAREVFEAFGYREVRTPLVEYTPLFVRTIGEATDIVEKEMYTFDDRDGRRLTLRPEGTASAVRAFIEHSVFAQEGVTRWYYAGPMFRHERAQRGRYRQFYQMGCEVFGVAEPAIDAEMIAMVVTLLERLGIAQARVHVNSLGGAEDRPAYRAALVDYFRGRLADLCADCQRRLEENPLRILDCKQERCARIAAGAPSILDHLAEPSRQHFDAVLAGLDVLSVPYVKDPRIVRGLDYYTKTVFEVVSGSGALGAQNTLCAGGRYDNLIEQLGGPAQTPAIGFAFGVERLVLAIPGEAESFDAGLDLFLVALGPKAQAWAFPMAHKLRLAGYQVELSHKAVSAKAQMKRADKLRARLALIVGDDELAQGQVKLRDMRSHEERMVSHDALLAELKATLELPRPLG